MGLDATVLRDIIRGMKMRFRLALGLVIAVAAAIFLRLLVAGSPVALFSPQGPVASGETRVIAESVLVMLAVAIPMLGTLFFFAWKYRADNPRATYEPNAKHGPWKELALWAIPASVVVVLGFIAWGSTFALDPYAPIASSKPPITIQVVALRWKWLFIYPEQGIATINFVEFPEQTPVHFELTADAPMSSFWIPELGSQIYAMAAMQTQLNLEAASTGEYPGRDTEINGEGYAGMTFTAKSVTDRDFENWVSGVKAASASLDRAAYDALAAPSQNDPPATYASVDPNLYEWVLTKDMTPAPADGNVAMPGMGM